MTTIYLQDSYICIYLQDSYIFTGQLYIYRTAICLQDSYIFTRQHVDTGARCVQKKKKNKKYYIILQGGELTCFHFFMSSC